MSENTKTHGFPENPTTDPDIYFPFDRYGGNPGVLIRADVDPVTLISAVRDEIRRVDKLAVLANVATADELLRPRTAQARFLSAVTGVFSGVALLLALVGIYGAISYTVAQRTREIGIRIAVGADRRDVLRAVLERGLTLITAGLALGIVGGLLAGRGISMLLFGIRATAPSVFITVAALILLTGVCAAYIPARRAALTDPLNALRED